MNTQLGQTERAQKCHEHFSQGIKLIETGKYKESLSSLRCSLYALLQYQQGKRNVGTKEFLQGVTEAGIYEQMARAWIGLCDLYLAIGYFNRWMEKTAEEYGDSSLELGRCYWKMGYFYDKLDICIDKNPFDIVNNPIDTHRNDKAERYYLKAYDILSKKLDKDNSELSNLRTEIINYYIFHHLGMTFESGLWIAIFALPLVAILSICILGFSVKAFFAIIISEVIYLIGRTIEAFICYRMDVRYYSKQFR